MTLAIRGRMRRVPALLCSALLPLAPLASGAGEEAPRVVLEVCANCHGADGNSTNPAYPRLAGLQVAYLGKQLREFKAGTRAHELMTPVIASLDDDAIRTLASHFSKQRPAAGRPGNARLAARGRAVYFEGDPEAGRPSCDGCHSADASGTPRFPRLAGQHAAYLYKQLDDIKHGRRNSSPLMQAVTQRMEEADMRAVAEYLGGL